MLEVRRDAEPVHTSVYEQIVWLYDQRRALLAELKQADDAIKDALEKAESDAEMWQSEVHELRLKLDAQA